MNVLLMVHHSFLEGESGCWMRAFVEIAAARDSGVTVFRRESHRFSDYDLIHCFGFGHFELLWNLQRAGKRTLCTPHLLPPPPRTLGARCAELGLRAIRMASQRAWAPRDQYLFLRGPDRFLLRGEGHGAWARSWKIPPGRVREIGEAPVAAVESAFSAYQELRGGA
jgi:hypothetical protein